MASFEAIFDSIRCTIALTNPSWGDSDKRGVVGRFFAIPYSQTKKDVTCAALLNMLDRTLSRGLTLSVPNFRSGRNYNNLSWLILKFGIYFFSDNFSIPIWIRVQIRGNWRETAILGPLFHLYKIFTVQFNVFQNRTRTINHC